MVKQRAVGTDSRQSMKTTTTVMIGVPLTGEEARFLCVLERDLSGIESLILASFHAGDREIDFVVITPGHTALIELKNFTLPIFGQLNGDWEYETAAGTRLRRGGENPWQQALSAKLALSDQMADYQRRNSTPAPADGKYFKQFGAFVCVYPRIHPRSQVTLGNKKVVVASYADVITAIRSNAVPSSWSIQDWKGFAETHLRLKASTLAAATDRNVDEATEKIQAYNSRLKSVIAVGLPPLPHAPADSSQGQGLVDSLLEPTNFMLVGPSGSAKTFHLHHLALAVSSKGEELTLMLEAKKYRRDDFWDLLRHGIGPLFRGDPKELLDSAALCGLRPVLMVDALNECAGDLIQDLLRDVQAFTLRYDARIVVTSQSRLDLRGVINSTTKELPLPDAQQKRSIYAYHSGLACTPDLEYFCSGFTNAYDLTIAGRCHNTRAKLESRSDLYDRYVRQCLPDHTVVQSAILRSLANEMADTLSVAWERDRFDTSAERFVQSQHASLTVLDDLRRSRLIMLTDEYFSFEHELLFDYFRADELRRRCTDVSELAREVTRPRNQELLEFILPRFSDDASIATLMAAATDHSILCRIVEGKCGAIAQALIVRQCEALLDHADQDLSHIDVACEGVTTEAGRTMLAGLTISGNRKWSAYDELLCRVIALNLDHPSFQRRFLVLLDHTESALKAAVSIAAKNARFNPDRVWGEAVRLFGGVIQHGTIQLPYVSITSAVRDARMRVGYRSGLHNRPQLFKRSPQSHFAIAALLWDLERDHDYDTGEKLALIQRAWDTGIYILRLESLELLQSMRLEIDARDAEYLPLAQTMLQGFDTDNVILNTPLLEAMASFGCLEPPVSLESALAEMRGVIAPGAVHDPYVVELAIVQGGSPSEYLASLAYGSLSKIFEDVFMSVYFDAYFALSDDEKRDILCLAAEVSDPGFATDWILRELIRYGGTRALPIYRKLASRIDGNTAFAQQAVCLFVTSIEALAQLNDVPPDYDGGDGPEHLAWKIIGEITFWHLRPIAHESHTQRIQGLWAQLTGPQALGVADVLYQINNSNWKMQTHNLVAELTTNFGRELQPIIVHCIANRTSLPSIFRFGGRTNREVVRFLIETLGTSGDASAIPVLRAAVDEFDIGKAAIQAIESIQKRLMISGVPVLG